MDDIYELFGKFELELLPKDWVDTLLKDDFSEAIDFPIEYEEFIENTDIAQLMLVACKYIKDWLENGVADISIASTSRGSLNTSQISSKSWQDLKSHNVHHKALISMLSIFILRGKTEKEFEHKRLGLIASDLYFVLLAIPGCEVFHIFNPILYSHAMENLKICRIFDSSKTLTKPKSKPKKRKGKNDDDSCEEEEEEMDFDTDRDDFSNSEKSIILESLINVMNNLIYSLQRFHLKGQDDSLLITIQILILLTRAEKTSSLILSRTPSSNNVSHLAYKAYQMLFKLCHPNNGDVSDICRIILKEMMPAFLIFCSDGLKMPAKEAQVIKDHSLLFVRNLLLTIKEPSFNSVLTLTQFVIAKIPDKADLRAKGVQVVLELMAVLPDPVYARAVVWTLTFSLNEQVKSRVTALEILTKLLQENERPPPLPTTDDESRRTSESVQRLANGHESEDDTDDKAERPSVTKSFVDAHYSTHKFLLAAIFTRIRDNAPSVRAKALTILASLFTTNNKSIKEVLESVFTTPYLNEEQDDTIERGFCNLLQLLKNRKTAKGPPPNPLPGAKAVIQTIEIFIIDDKVFVRKAALQVLSNIFIMNEKWMTTKLLQLMVDNMRDISVMVRKLLVQCLTDLLLHYPTHAELPKFWVRGVMPLLMEDEMKAQERVLEMLQKVVLENLVAYNQMKSPLHSLPWIVLDLIVLNSQKLFSKACEYWAKSNSIKQNMISIIKTHIGTENNSTAWYLLASLSEYLNIKDPQFVLDYFYENVLNTQQVDEYCCQLVTEVMHTSCRQLPKINQVQLCETLLKHLSQFTIPLPMVARCVDICHLVTESHTEPPEKGREDTKVWATVLIHTCENRLEKVIGPDSPAVLEDDNRLCQYILTLGEACQICPGVMKESTVDLVENLLANHENYPGSDTDFQGTFWRGKVSAAVQGFAVVTLGKLCLQKAKTAKTLVPLLGSLLSCSPHAEIKINAMIALTDMCIKFTSMVENFLPEMCMCLKDKRLAVRENTLKLLIQMIQEDYLKLRCPMFFHILTMLLDDELIIRDMTSSFIINSLLKKKKDALVQHFVEALLHYNAYLEHATYARLEKMSARERALFSLEGPENQEKRRSIYRFMVENMMDDQRFKVTNRLCNDILSEVAEGNIKLTSSGMTLLQDALYVLSSDEIRFSQLKRGGKDDDDNDGGEEAHINHAINNLARKTLINEVMKKNLIDNVVPIFIKLKHTLQQMKSSLVRDLMACLRELMKDYKQEIDEILSADRELAAEIAHDLKALEAEECEEERKSEANESVTEVLKKVMELSVHRKSLNGKSPRKSRSTRLSTSSAATMNSDKSAVSPRSQNVPSVPPSPASNFSPPSNRPSPGSSKSSPGSSVFTPTSNGCANKKQVSPSAMSSKSDASEAMDEDPAPSIRSRRNRASTGSNKSTKPVSPSSCSSKCTPEAMEEDTFLTTGPRRKRPSTSPPNQSTKQISPSSQTSKSMPEAMEEDPASSMRSRRNRSSASSNQSGQQVSPSSLSTQSHASVPESVEETASSVSSVRSRQSRASTSSSEASTSQQKPNARRTRKKK